MFAMYPVGGYVSDDHVRDMIKIRICLENHSGNYERASKDAYKIASTWKKPYNRGVWGVVNDICHIRDLLECSSAITDGQPDALFEKARDISLNWPLYPEYY
jgi:hypothetical protein